MGEPPLFGSRLSLITMSPGMKKLVPAWRSSRSSTPAASRTGNASSASTAVVNQDQQVSGIRISDIPRQRMFSRVVMKLSAPSSEATQKIAMLAAHSVAPAPCPGPAAGIAESGG
jgi:hypothetical protein